MASKKKLNTRDNVSFDDELDIPDFDGMPIAPKDNRSPGSKIASTAFGGFKSGVTDKKVMRKAIFDNLPAGYGEASETLTGVTDSLRDTYQTASRTMRPAAREFAKTVDRLVPSSSTRVKALTTKFSKLFDNNDQGHSEDKQAAQDSIVNSATESIFQFQMEQDAKTQDRDDAKEKIQEGVNFLRHKDITGVLSSMDNSLQRQSQYTEKVTAAYQKKSLELQFRTLFAISDQLELARKTDLDTLSHLGNISKNTALPDFVKMNKAEHLKAQLTNKFYGSISNKLGKMTDPLLKMVKLVGEDIKSAAGMAADAMSMVAMGGDMSAMEDDEFEMTHGRKRTLAEKAGKAAGGWIGRKTANSAVGGVVKKIAKNKTVQSVGEALKYGVENQGGLLKSFGKSRTEQEGAKGEILDYFKDLAMRATGQDLSIKKTNDNVASSPAIFTNKISQSITDIIPGYLARILQELSVMRSGDPKSQMVVYDHIKGRFASHSSASRSVFTKVANTHNKETIVRSLDDSIKELDPDGSKLTPAQKDILKKELLADQMKGDGFVAKKYRNASAFKAEGSKEDKEAIAKMIADVFPDQPGLGIKDMVSPENTERVQKLGRMQKHLRTAGNGVDDPRELLQELFLNGQGDLLSSTKVLDKNGNLNLDALAKLMLDQNYTRGSDIAKNMGGVFGGPSGGSGVSSFVPHPSGGKRRKRRAGGEDKTTGPIPPPHLSGGVGLFGSVSNNATSSGSPEQSLSETNVILRSIESLVLKISETGGGLNTAMDSIANFDYRGTGDKIAKKFNELKTKAVNLDYGKLATDIKDTVATKGTELMERGGKVIDVVKKADYDGMSKRAKKRLKSLQDSASETITSINFKEKFKNLKTLAGDNSKKSIDYVTELKAKALEFYGENSPEYIESAKQLQARLLRRGQELKNDAVLGITNAKTTVTDKVNELRATHEGDVRSKIQEGKDYASGKLQEGKALLDKHAPAVTENLVKGKEAVGTALESLRKAILGDNAAGTTGMFGGAFAGAPSAPISSGEETGESTGFMTFMQSFKDDMNAGFDKVEKAALMGATGNMSEEERKALSAKLGSGGKGFLNYTVKDIFKGAGSLARRAGGTALDIAKNAINLGSSIGSRVLGGAMSLTKGVGGFINDHTKQEFDVYMDGSPEPIMTSAKLKLGAYTDQTSGKVIKKYKDLKPGFVIVDSDGKVIFDYKDIDKAKIKRKGKLIPFAKALAEAGIKAGKNAFDIGSSLAKTAFGVLGVAVPPVIAMGIKLAKGAFGFAKNILSDYPVDMYIQGEPEPRIYAVDMEAGKYYSSTDDQVVMKPSKMSGAIYTTDDKGNKKIVVKEEELSKLVGADGKPIIGRGAKLARKLIGSIGSGIKMVNRLVTGTIKGAMKTVGGFLKGGIPGAMGSFGSLFEQGVFSSSSKTVTVLEAILALLEQRIPKNDKAANDVDGDGYRDGSWQTRGVRTKVSSGRGKEDKDSDKDDNDKDDDDNDDDDEGIISKGMGYADTAMDALDLLRGKKRRKGARARLRRRRNAAGGGRLKRAGRGITKFGSGLLGKAKGLKNLKGLGKAGLIAGAGAAALGGIKSFAAPAVSAVTPALTTAGTVAATHPGSVAAGAGKIGAKTLGKTLLKSGIKKIPLIGALAGLGFGAQRAFGGDFLGAGGEVLSGLAGTIPGLGTAASVGIDAALAARDYKKDKDAEGVVTPDGQIPGSVTNVATPTGELDKTKEEPSSGFSFKNAAKTALKYSPIGVMMKAGEVAQEAGSKLFNYTSNRVSDAVGGTVAALDAVRFKSYGLTDLPASKVANLRRLETAALEDMSYSPDGKATWAGDPVKLLSTIGGDFGVSQPDGADGKSFLKWIAGRFLPIFTAYVTECKVVSGKQTPKDAVAGILPTKALPIANAIASVGSAWGVSDTPWPGFGIGVDKSVITGNLTALKAAFKDSNSKEEAKGGDADKSKTTTETTGAASLWDKTKNMAADVWQGAKDIGNKTWEGAKDMGAAVWGGAKNLAAGGMEAVTNAANATGAAVGQAASYSSTALSNAYDSTVKITDTAIKGIYDFASSAAGAGKEGIKALVGKAANAVGVDSSLLQTIAAVESNFVPTATPGTSSAKGLFQFINGTWETMVKKYGAKYGISMGTSPFNPAANAIMGALFIRDNIKAMSGIKKGISVTDVYLAHFLGLGGARKFLTAMQKNPNAIAAEFMPKEAKANHSIFFDKNKKPRTFQEVYDELGKRLDAKRKQFNIPISSSMETATPVVTGAGAPPGAPAGVTNVAGGSKPPPSTPPSSGGAGGWLSSAYSNTVEVASRGMSSVSDTAKSIGSSINSGASSVYNAAKGGAESIFGTIAGDGVKKDGATSSSSSSGAGGMFGLLYDLASRYAGKIKYGFGSKNLSSGSIDCSGWIEAINKELFNKLPKGKEFIKKIFNGMGAAGILKNLFGTGAAVLSKEQMTPATLKEGMIIGERNGASFAKGRFYDIDHITQVVRDPNTKQLMISQSSGKVGVSLQPVDKYLAHKKSSRKNTGLWGVDLNEAFSKIGGVISGDSPGSSATPSFANNTSATPGGEVQSSSGTNIAAEGASGSGSGGEGAGGFGGALSGGGSFGVPGGDSGSPVQSTAPAYIAKFDSVPSTLTEMLTTQKAILGVLKGIASAAGSTVPNPGSASIATSKDPEVGSKEAEQRRKLNELRDAQDNANNIRKQKTPTNDRAMPVSMGNKAFI